MNGGKEEEIGSDPISRGQCFTGQLCQASHLEMREKCKQVHGQQGLLEGLPVPGLAPTPLGLSTSESLSFLGWGFMASWGGAKPLALWSLPLITVGLPAVQSPTLPLARSFGESKKVLGKVPRVTEQTAPSPPQSLG